MIKTWFVNTCNVKDLVIAGSITFSSLVEKPSNPQLCLLGRLFIILFTVYSSILLNVKAEFTFLFR